MNAAALIVLILALIGIGMIGYYAMICLQIRHPKRRKLPRNSDMGPLLNNEDFNGNHEEPIIAEEDRPSELPEASAPKPEENDDQASKNEDLEIPVKSVSFQNTPECASIKPSSKEESIALDIDEEPPVLDNSKSVLHPSHDRVLGLKTSPVTLQKSHNEAPPHFIAENETHYNAMSDSYEEDGLLVPGSQHKSLLKEPRKRLHAQRSAPPEGYVPHQQLLVQRNTQPHPKHVQFADPRTTVESTTPVNVTNLHDDNTHQTVRPKLKSPLSDPGTSKEKNIFVFGANHEREARDEKPMKKVKITDDENISDVPTSTPICSQSIPAVGWVVNLPQHTPSVSEKQEVALDMENIESERSTTQPLATSEIDHTSARTNEKCFISPEYSPISRGDEVIQKIEFEQTACVSDSDNSSSDDASNLPSKELRLHDESRGGSGSESSEPDLTEYSFERGPHTPDPAVSIVLQNEVSCYLENKIGLTNYVPIPETTYLPKNNQQPVEETSVIGQPPPTPTSDTKSISPISSNDNSLDEINSPSPSFIPTNVLGTPPQTPPVDDKTSTYIPESPMLITSNESAPSFIVIDTHNSQRRSSSDSLSSSLSSSSSSNGSYKLDATNNEIKNVQEAETEKPNTVKVRIMKD